MVSHANAVLESRQYDPIGNAIGTTSTSQTSYGFTGEMTFGGLLHLRARDYNPALGVFTAQDFLENTNRYTYASSNPVNRVDRNGLQDTPIYCYPEIGDDGILVWICPEDSDGFPPVEIIGPPGEVVWPIQIGIKPQQRERRRQIDCRKKENRRLDECKEYWDDQEPPKNCACPTNRHPGSRHPFASAYDMRCNLNCYNGSIPYVGYLGLAWFHGVRMEMLAGNGVVPGVFLYPGQNLRGLDDPLLLGMNVGYDSDIVALSQRTSRGGTIGVRQTNANHTRATRMATLVEEITHAANYHGFFGDCTQMSARDNERIAKTAKVAWIAISGIELMHFFNPETLFDDIAGAIGRYSEDQRAFLPCPNEAIGTFVSFTCIEESVRRVLI